MVVGDFYDRKETGVDRFCFGEDYRPDMMPDVASVVDKKHIFGVALKKKVIE